MGRGLRSSRGVMVPMALAFTCTIAVVIGYWLEVCSSNFSFASSLRHLLHLFVSLPLNSSVVFWCFFCFFCCFLLFFGLGLVRLFLLLLVCSFAVGVGWLWGWVGAWGAFLLLLLLLLLFLLFFRNQSTIYIRSLVCSLCSCLSKLQCQRNDIINHYFCICVTYVRFKCFLAISVELIHISWMHSFFIHTWEWTQSVPPFTRPICTTSLICRTETAESCTITRKYVDKGQGRLKLTNMHSTRCVSWGALARKVAFWSAYWKKRKEKRKKQKKKKKKIIRERERKRKKKEKETK